MIWGVTQHKCVTQSYNFNRPPALYLQDRRYPFKVPLTGTFSTNIYCLKYKVKNTGSLNEFFSACSMCQSPNFKKNLFCSVHSVWFEIHLWTVKTSYDRYHKIIIVSHIFLILASSMSKPYWSEWQSFGGKNKKVKTVIKGKTVNRFGVWNDKWNKMTCTNEA